MYTSGIHAEQTLKAWNTPSVPFVNLLFFVDLIHYFGKKDTIHF